MSRAARNVQATVAELLEAGAAAIGEASDTPALDARVLLQTIMNKDHAWLITHAAETVEAGDSRRFREWTRRRARSEPIAYIIERKAFWNAELKVTPDVLVPRPETELLVEKALEKIPLSESMNILDLGTGSGAVALAIAAERPLCKITATDTSPAALKIAEQNKARLGLRNVDFKLGDWYHAVDNDRFTVIVCNPPYVPDSHYAAALTYEPEESLFAGPIGLDALEIVIQGAASHLEPAGWLLVEHGYNQDDTVQDLFEQAGYVSIVTYRDNAGHPRITKGRLCAR